MSNSFSRKIMDFIGFGGDSQDQTTYEKEVSQVEQVHNKIRNVQRFPSSNDNETVCILEISSYSQMEDLLMYIKNRDTVVVCIDSVSDVSEKIKILHFLFGATAALDGNISKVKEDIYVSAPSNVNLNHILKETKRSKDSRFRF